MPADPKLVLDEEVVRFILSLSALKRRKLLTHLEQLRTRWNETPDFRQETASSRWLSVRVFRPYAITYWLDGSVDELRVVDIQQVFS